MFNNINFSIDESGYYVNQNGEYLQDCVWTFFKGKIPDGYVVRYKSNDRYDVRLSNLEIVQIEQESTTQHAQHHELTDDDRLKASDWHKSEEGRATHSKIASILHKRKTFEHKLVCTCCGKKYTGKIYSKTSNHFCSSRCRTKYFRQHKKGDSK